MPERRSRKAIYAANRAAGLCGCGRKPRPGYKTCKRCAKAGQKVTAKYRRYARKHGCTIAEAMLATRTRKWNRATRTLDVSLVLSLLQGLANRGLDVFDAMNLMRESRESIESMCKAGMRGLHIEQYLWGLNTTDKENPGRVY